MGRATATKANKGPDTLKDVAEALDLSVRRVNQLADEGVLPRDGRGAYSVDGCLRAYVRYLQGAMKKKAIMGPDGEVSSLQGGRNELLSLQVERERFELAKAKGLSMPIEEHERILADLIQETKARVRAVGSRIAPELVGETSRLMIQAKLERAHDEALVQLSKVVPRIPIAIEEAEDTEEAPRDQEAEKPKKKPVRAKSKKKPVPVKPKAKAATRGR